LRVNFEDGTSQEVTVPVKIGNDALPTPTSYRPRRLNRMSSSFPPRFCWRPHRHRPRYLVRRRQPSRPTLLRLGETKFMSVWGGAPWLSLDCSRWPELLSAFGVT